MDGITKRQLDDAEHAYAAVWNKAAGGDEQATVIAAAIDLAGLRIASALQDVVQELRQLPRG